MTIYDNSFTILKSVLKEKISFATATKIHSKNIKNEEKGDVSSFCGLFLRNYYAILAIAEFIFKTKDVEPLIYIGLVFMNNSYKKALDFNESLKYLGKKLELYQIKFDDERKTEFNKAISNKKEYLSQILKNNGTKLISAKCNTPERVIKMLFRQYDQEIAKKTMNNIVKMPLQFAVVNNKLAEGAEEEIKSRFSHEKGNLYKFNSTTSIRKDPLVRTFVMNPIQKGEYLAAEMLPDVHDGKIAIYYDGKSSLHVELLNRYLDDNKIEIFTSEGKLHKELFTGLKPKNLPNLEIHEAKQGEMITYLPEKQDIVVMMPKSSELELLRRTPEYGISFDTNTLDKIIENEHNYLLDGANLVKDEGVLMYAVATFNIKETLVMSRKFLAERKDFKLVKENTYFPYEEHNTIFYVAVFKKDR